MSLSSDYLNSLPTELLVKVLDYLNLKDVLELSTVCVRWYEILSADRYIARRRLRLEPALLDQDNYIQLERYRSVAIRSYFFSKINDQRKLQQYLYNSEAVEMLEDLSITLEELISFFVFDTENELKLPNLHTLYISEPRVGSNRMPLECRIVAPNLKTIYHDCKTRKPLLELFSDQIENLDVNDSFELGHFYLITLGLPFTNLRSLTVTDAGWTFQDGDFLPGHTAAFSRLNHLKIVQGTAMLSANIISQSKNLTSLEISYSSIDQTVFSLINQLKELNELVLLASIKFDFFVIGLSLPKLTKFTMDSFIRFDSVPSLTSLTISDLESIPVDYVDFVNAQFCMIAYHLRSLTLDDLVINDRLFNHICALVNLNTLKMTKVVILNPFGVIQLISCLRKLKLVRFTDCVIVRCAFEAVCACAYCQRPTKFMKQSEDEPKDSSSSKYESKYERKDGPWTGSVEDFYTTLERDNSHCAIVGDGGQVEIRHIRRRYDSDYDSY